MIGRLFRKSTRLDLAFYVMTHGIFFLLFFGVASFLVFAFHGTIQLLTLPGIFFSYCVIAGLGIWRTSTDKRHEFVALSIFILGVALIACFGFLVFQHTYDTSYDGQSYHQSAVISLLNGWNPLHDRSLPQPILQGDIYVQGYPKLYWELYAASAKTTGNLQMATALNLIPILIAAIAVTYFLRRTLKLSPLWTVCITSLSVLSIYAIQQLFTFMEDGTSYEFGLAAIALLGSILLTKKPAPWRLITSFLGLLIILMGVKDNNAPFVILLGAIYLINIIRSKQIQQKQTLLTLLRGAICGAFVLWVPFGTNIIREHSVIYPMNISSASSNLRYDNIPPNIRKDGAPMQLFYGIFSTAQPSSAGDVKSPANVAKLKVPFTFTATELRSLADFLGRTGSAGVLFGGSLIIALLLFIQLFIKANGKYDERVLGYGALIIGAIIVLGLVNPVPNKLRYAPFITLIPLIVVVLSLLQKKQSLGVAIGRLVLTVIVGTNLLLAAWGIVQVRSSEFATISQQTSYLKTVHQPLGLVSKQLSSVQYRLNQAGIETASVAKHCPTITHGEAVAASFGTAYVCIPK